MSGVIRRLCRRFGIDIQRYSPARRLATESDHAIQQLLAGRRVQTVFDVGANLGQSAKFYRSIFPAATVHSFEPSADTHAALSAACAGDPQIRTWQLAISDGAGTREFFINADHTTSSLLAAAEGIHNPDLREKLAGVGSVEVKCETLDSFCRQQAIGEIDLLKLDIQGAELQALQGGAELFRAGRVRLVFCEVLFSPLYRNACDFSLISNAMKSFGYTLYGLYNLHHFASDGLLWGDAIFVHPALLGQDSRAADRAPAPN